jgi:phosphatidylglycerol:prolipoprotein diacylglycerol transferase
MHPILVHAGPLVVHSYGVMIALAAFAGGVVLRRDLGHRVGRGDAAFALILAATVGGFLGARGYYLLEHAGSDGLLGATSGAGFTWYGGVIGGAAAVLLTARYRKVPLHAVLAATGPALALGYGIGRIGCQLAGDGTYGTPSTLPWAMSYPHGEVPTTQRVHPTPVYETLASLLIFAVLWRLRERLAPARLFGLYLVLAGGERFLVEFVRRNDHVFLGLSQPQLFAAGLGVVGLALLTVPLPHGARRAARPQPTIPT